MDTEHRYARLAAAPFLRTDASGLTLDVRGGKIREIFQRRELLRLLVRRDLQARYRDSFLGFLWTVIRPIITANGSRPPNTPRCAIATRAPASSPSARSRVPSSGGKRLQSTATMRAR